MAFVGSAVFGGKDLGRVQKNVRIQSMGAYMVSPGIQIGKPKTQIGKPKTNIGGGSTSTEVEQQAKKQRPKPKYKTDADEIPMYKVRFICIFAKHI